MCLKNILGCFFIVIVLFVLLKKKKLYETITMLEHGNLDQPKAVFLGYGHSDLAPE